MALRRMKSAQQRRERGTAGASVNGGDATAPPQTLGVVARIECKAGVRQSAKTAILYRTENMRLDAMQSLNPNYLGESRLAMEFRQSLFNTGRLWSRSEVGSLWDGKLPTAPLSNHHPPISSDGLIQNLFSFQRFHDASIDF
ncbi:Zn(II)2Cys6 transcription factor [Aspergillus luchuensis]|uniref:Zn(II)2Cys6 transcription factor n=1 Tax=Aspergillus kawachii TaxID=1069201 RepID=A0A146FH24_ASPKA|nr:Zn(II)2Cys6 transcription factor [Aspergillus luchuensis]